MKKILIVDDEETIRELIKLNLEVAGYKCEEAIDGEDALKIIKTDNFDLVLLDIMMPKVDGYEVAKELLNKGIPVIFLSAKDSTLDKVKGLKLGVEDYITKPFESMELLARVENVLRRNSKNNFNEFSFKNIKIDFDSRLVYMDDNIIDLTTKEFELLNLLIKNRNIALSREKILEMVWNYNEFVDTRTIDMHIQKLRSKLNLEDEIVTVRGYGYRFVIK